MLGLQPTDEFLVVVTGITGLILCGVAVLALVRAFTLSRKSAIDVEEYFRIMAEAAQLRAEVERLREENERLKKDHGGSATEVTNLAR